MQFRYRLDDRPPLLPLLLFGLQWLAIAVPAIVIIGGVVGHLQSSDPAAQTLYLQKLALVGGLTMAVQVLWGHRLPLVAGPAAVLLVGVVASRGYPDGVVYGSILVGGLLLTLLAAVGLFAGVVRLFTPRVVAAVLLLIAFTLLPTIRDLLLDPGSGAPPLVQILFALALALLLYAAQRFLAGVWQATLIVWGVLFGSAAWLLVYPPSAGSPGLPLFALPLHAWALPAFAVDPGVLTAFLCCFLALAVNDLGSMQGVASLLQPEGMPGRIGRGMAVTGLGNALAGALGVLGPVDFSLSPGVIAATGCASRYVLLPAAAALLLLSCSPLALAVLGAVPPVVVGATLLFILSSQVAAGLLALVADGAPLRFEHGLVLGLPLLFGTVIAFLPPAVVAGFPAFLRPVLGNGFVVGTLTAILLEHLLVRPQ